SSMSSLTCQLDVAKLCLFSPTFLCLALVSMLLVPLSEALKRRSRQPIIVTTQVRFCASACANLTPIPVPQLGRLQPLPSFCANLCPFHSSLLCHNAVFVI